MSHPGRFIGSEPITESIAKLTVIGLSTENNTEIPEKMIAEKYLNRFFLINCLRNFNLFFIVTSSEKAKTSPIFLFHKTGDKFFGKNRH